MVAVIDAGEDGGHPYIVFEYVEGETLKQRIDRLGRLPLDEAAAYAIEIGRGLAAAHARGSSTATSSRRTSSSTPRAGPR